MEPLVRLSVVPRREVSHLSVRFCGAPLRVVTAGSAVAKRRLGKVEVGLACHSQLAVSQQDIAPQSFAKRLWNLDKTKNQKAFCLRDAEVLVAIHLFSVVLTASEMVSAVQLVGKR